MSPAARAVPVGLCLALLATPASSWASVKSSGEVSVDGRAFWPDDEDATEDFGLAVTGRLEVKLKEKPWRFELRGLGRVGAVDKSRSVVILEEAFLGFRMKPLRIRIGPQLLNWTATEAFHPADVMQSRNFDSNIENADKIGEPMVNVRLRMWQGALELYYMPFRMDPLLPGPGSRLSFAPPGTRLGDPVWVGRDGEADDAGVVEHQFAVRLSQTIDYADIALQFVQHQDRTQPTIALDPGTFTAHPVYHMVNHFGLTYTQVLGEWILKVEGAYRMFDDDPDLGSFVPVGAAEQADHLEVALGLEWGWEYESGAQATVLLEGQAYFLADEEELEQLGPFQRDVLLGYRHSFNDVEGTELLIGVIMDLQRFPEILGNISFSRRLSDTWTMTAALRITHAPPDDPDQPVGLQGLHQAHNVQLSFSRHF